MKDGGQYEERQAAGGGERSSPGKKEATGKKTADKTAAPGRGAKQRSERQAAEQDKSAAYTA